MDEATRVTRTGTFITLGTTMLIGVLVRWLLWKDDGGIGQHPQVLWTMGFLGLAFVLAALQLWLPVFARERARQRAAFEARQRDDWTEQ